MPIALRGLWLLSLTLLLLEGQALGPGRYRVLQGEVVYRATTALSAWSGRNESLRVLLDPDPWGVKKEGVLCLQTGSTPFTILTQKPAR